MTDSTRKYIKLAQDYVMITLGLFTYAFGFTAFILPEKIVIGSVTGLSSLIHYWVGWNVALTYYAINIILLCIAFRSVGKQFVLRTIIGASISTLFIGVLQQHRRHRHHCCNGRQAQHHLLWPHHDVLRCAHHLLVLSAVPLD